MYDFQLTVDGMSTAIGQCVQKNANPGELSRDKEFVITQFLNTVVQTALERQWRLELATARFNVH